MKKLFAVTLFTLALPFSVSAEDSDQAKLMKKTDYLIEKMDGNKDGKVSKEEYEVYSARKFKIIDSNNDGSISRDELLAYKMKELQESRELFGK